MLGFHDTSNYQVSLHYGEYLQLHSYTNYQNITIKQSFGVSALFTSEIMVNTCFST